MVSLFACMSCQHDFISEPTVEHHQLNCGHFICRKCLTRPSTKCNSTSSQAIIRCLVCNKTTLEGLLQEDLSLKLIMQLVKRSLQACVECNSPELRHCTDNCQGLMCDHSSAAKRLSPSCLHKNSKLLSSMCLKHAKMCTRCFCQECQTLTCFQCTDSCSHRKKKINQVTTEPSHRHDHALLASLTNYIEDRKRELNDIDVQLEKNIEEIKKQVEEAHMAMKSQLQQHRQTVEKEEKAIAMLRMRQTPFEKDNQVLNLLADKCRMNVLEKQAACRQEITFTEMIVSPPKLECLYKNPLYKGMEHETNPIYAGSGKPLTMETNDIYIPGQSSEPQAMAVQEHTTHQEAKPKKKDRPTMPAKPFPSKLRPSAEMELSEAFRGFMEHGGVVSEQSDGAIQHYESLKWSRMDTPKPTAVLVLPNGKTLVCCKASEPHGSDIYVYRNASSEQNFRTLNTVISMTLNLQHQEFLYLTNKERHTIFIRCMDIESMKETRKLQFHINDLECALSCSTINGLLLVFYESTNNKVF